MPSHRRPTRRPHLALALLAMVTVVASLVVGSSADASQGSDPFVSGRTYTGDFPDPWVVRAGSTYYAYSTNTANLNLPAMTSHDLVHWTAAGDAMPSPGSWTKRLKVSDRTVTRTWAPSVTYVGRHFVLAYAAPIDAGGPRKNCIGLASSARPGGPFVDHSSHPVVCPSDQGAIDPQVFVDGGRPYLVWKTEGIVGRAATVIWSQPLSGDGMSFVPGTSPTPLLTTALPWEGHVIENPAMIRVNGLLYLFYSANEYVSADYAIGYAVCQSVAGPCVRPSTEPLMASGGAVSGPGGPAPFVGPDGRLRLAYAAWNLGRTGYPTSSRCKGACNQRRLHVARLDLDGDGLLHVTDRG